MSSVVTYQKAYHRGYRTAEVNATERGYLVQSCGFFAALQSVRAGEIAGATRQMEEFCFDSAEIALKDPQPPPYDQMAKNLARELLKYRATYRTNSADWDAMERKLQVQLTKAK